MFKCGWKCYLELKGHFKTEYFEDKKASKENIILQSANYDGNRNFTLDHYYNLVKKAFVQLEIAGPMKVYRSDFQGTLTLARAPCAQAKKIEERNLGFSQGTYQTTAQRSVRWALWHHSFAAGSHPEQTRLANPLPTLHSLLSITLSPQFWGQQDLKKTFLSPNPSSKECRKSVPDT